AGPVIPFTLESDAQRRCFIEGSPGWHRAWYRTAGAWRSDVGAHASSAGPNEAFWLPVLQELGGFRATTTGDGGLGEMISRVLTAGHTVVYEPSAVVRSAPRVVHNDRSARLQRLDRAAKFVQPSTIESRSLAGR